MGYNLAKVEQEVVITFNAGEDTAELYTADPVYIRKMDKLVQQNPEQFKEIRQEKLEGKVVAKRYTLPKRFVSIRSKAKTMTMTDEQKAESAERLRASRQVDSTVEN